MTHTKDEALHRAQSAISYTILALSNGNDLTYAKACLESALTAIKQVIAAPNVQKPVDSVQAIGNLIFALTTWKATTPKTAPAAWKKLLQACAEMVATEQAAQPAPCTWTKSNDPNTPDTFDSNCGVVWTFTDGGPGENNVRFCPGCGGKLVEGQS
jgi:hypothetical protein